MTEPQFKPSPVQLQMPGCPFAVAWRSPHCNLYATNLAKSKGWSVPPRSGSLFGPCPGPKEALTKKGVEISCMPSQLRESQGAVGFSGTQVSSELGGIRGSRDTGYSISVGPGGHGPWELPLEND